MLIHYKWIELGCVYTYEMGWIKAPNIISNNHLVASLHFSKFLSQLWEWVAGGGLMQLSGSQAPDLFIAGSAQLYHLKCHFKIPRMHFWKVEMSLSGSCSERAQHTKQSISRSCGFVILNETWLGVKGRRYRESRQGYQFYDHNRAILLWGRYFDMGLIAFAIWMENGMWKVKMHNQMNMLAKRDTLMFWSFCVCFTVKYSLNIKENLQHQFPDG